MNLVSPASRRLLRAVAIILLAIIILGCGFWVISALHYNRVIDGWIATQRAAGDDVQFERRHLGGFPFHIFITFDSLNWRNADAVVFHAAQMILKARLWQASQFDAEFKGPVSLNAQMPEGHAFVLSGDNGSAHVELNRQGEWRASNASVQNASFGIAPAYLFTANQLQVAVMRPDQPPKDHSEAGLTVKAGADTLSLPASMPTVFGAKMTRLALALRVMDAMPDFRRRDSVDAWNKDSGVVEFDDWQMQWGALDLKAKGTIGFDDDLQPEGAFAASIGGQEQVLRILSEQGYVPQRQQAMLQSALTMFAKPQGTGAAPAALPITIQLGGIFIGPIKIFSFPAITWPDAAVPPSVPDGNAPVP